MVEQAYLMVQVREPGRTHSKIVIQLIDGAEIELVVNNHDLVAVERNPRRTQSGYGGGIRGGAQRK